MGAPRVPAKTPIVSLMHRSRVAVRHATVRTADLRSTPETRFPRKTPPLRIAAGQPVEQRRRARYASLIPQAIGDDMGTRRPLDENRYRSRCGIAAGQRLEDGAAYRNRTDDLRITGASRARRTLRRWC